VSAQSAKLNIAVSDLAGQGIDPSSVSIISDRLRTELFKQGGFSVLERNSMQDILKEQGFQQSGCTTDACAIQIGQILNVSYMVVGTVGKLGYLFTVDVRVIDVATAKIIYSENVDCNCPIEKVLTNSVVSIAQKISTNVKSTENPPQISIQLLNNQAVTDVSHKSTENKKTASLSTNTPKKNKRLALKITCGAVAVVAAGAGLAFDNMLKDEIDDNKHLATEYQSLPGNTQYDFYYSKISKNSEDATTYKTARNISYILAGLGVIGFTVSFLF
jgi:curli biogenesis system outer membrane secretion channel CsgG